MDKDFYMAAAIKEALKSFDEGEVPVGAIIVKDDKIIGYGRNRKECKKDPVSHAEIEAIQMACKTLDDWRLNGSTMFVTAEPCIMCCGAILHARIDKVYFGVRESKFGGVVSKAEIFDSINLNHKTKWEEGIMADEISIMMKEFFNKLRQR